MKHAKNPVFLHNFSKFMGILLFVFEIYVYFFASETDKRGFLTSKQQKSWPVPLKPLQACNPPRFSTDEKTIQDIEKRQSLTS